jgi:hypothetical protein
LSIFALVTVAIETSDPEKDTERNPKHEGGMSIYITIHIMQYLGQAVAGSRLILPAALDPGVHSASNRNEYQKQKNISGE